eukprot:gb/GECG01004206.1/.p1 GENE.gb/GECG01004206.1/~~gb/GECG01004206.1/.p1  ORF type:complete len:179 (+),score=15.71 gb/GECG01004206.1/:1-537(+)
MEITASFQHSLSIILLSVFRTGKKRNMVPRLMAATKPKAVLVFTNSKSKAVELSSWLREAKRIPTVELVNDGRNNKTRTRALNQIRTGSCSVLVATEMAARGLDIPSLTHVINYDLPQDVRAYIHRAGRVGRTNSPETAVCLSLTSSKEETIEMDDIGKVLNIKMNEAFLKEGKLEMK